MRRFAAPAVTVLACALMGAGAMLSTARADEVFAEAHPEAPAKWHAPFGGSFNANFTVASDYAQNGISNTQLNPAFQAALDYRSPDLIAAVPLYFYGTLFGSTVSFPVYGPGTELDAIGGVKMKLMDRKLSFDVGYIRYNYPEVPATAGYDYGEFNFAAAYDFGWIALNARLRFSPDSIGHSGHSWNKRALVSAPLPFIGNDTFSFKALAAVGNYWVDRFDQAGLPSQDYWYWTVGVVTSAWGLDMLIAYTDTSIEYEGCNYTRYCASRGFISLTKTF